MHPELKLGATGDPKLLTNVEAVFGSLDNIFRTVIGERVMLRSFAINFMSMLFEPINESLLKAQFVDEMKDQIMKWEPRVSIEYLDITANRDYSTIYVRLEMYIRGYEQAFTFSKEYQI
jgi:phage baseplate assembly protein W